jgi:hypothetical protein
MERVKVSGRQRLRFTLVGAAAVACLAIGVPVVALASSSAPATPRCSQSDTYVWFALSPNGTTGAIYYPVEFTNTGGSACTLTGYPGVSAISAKLRQLGLSATRVAAPARTVTVQPKQTVHAFLGILPRGFIRCHNATADGLKVYPPNEKGKQFVLSFTFSVCKNKPDLQIYPVAAGIGVP